MTCMGTSKPKDLLLIPKTLTRIIKLYCLATIALQKVGNIVEGIVIGDRIVALNFLGGMEGREEVLYVVGGPFSPLIKLLDGNEG